MCWLLWSLEHDLTLSFAKERNKAFILKNRYNMDFCLTFYIEKFFVRDSNSAIYSHFMDYLPCLQLYCIISLFFSIIFSYSMFFQLLQEASKQESVLQSQLSQLDKVCLNQFGLHTCLVFYFYISDLFHIKWMRCRVFCFQLFSHPRFKTCSHNGLFVFITDCLCFSLCCLFSPVSLFWCRVNFLKFLPHKNAS